MGNLGKTDLARKYRTEYDEKFKEQFPNGMPTLKLARIMYNENKLLFSNVHNARVTLSRIEGKMTKGVGVKVTHKHPERPKNPYNLPESFQEKREPFRLPKSCNNILLISDLHIPYHDVDAITIAMKYGVENKINTVFINGDLIDNAQVSKFESDLKKRRPKEEFDTTKAFLVSLRKTFPSAEIYWLKGNHCIRWEKFLMAKVKEIWDDPYFHLEQRLALNEQRIKLLDDKVLVKVGKLSITHGHHIFKGIFTPVSPARGAYMKSKQNVIVGHLHRPSYHPESDLDGNIVAAWSCGCLCETKPNYSPLVSNSQHGFAHITIEPNGDFTVKNYSIIKGKIH
jgi:predicted phosphodiesterase